MKIKIKNINSKTKKSSRKAIVKPIHSSRSKLRFFRIIEHKNTGKLVHHSHTSHLSLMIILLLTGLFMSATTFSVSAVNQSNSLTVSAVVDGPAPSIGATITDPKDGSRYQDRSSLVISGNCEPYTFVSVTDNDIPAGSATCSSEGVFSLAIQVYVGSNVIKARNYDNLNQAGPDTPSIVVYNNKSTIEPEKPSISPVNPGNPENPSIIVNYYLDSCDDLSSGNQFPVGGEVRIAIVCLPRLFLADTSQKLGLMIWGGEGPYAISMDLGDEKEGSLFSRSSTGYLTLPISYVAPGIYKVYVRVSDRDGQIAFTYASVRVNGVRAASGSAQSSNDGIYWLIAPVPLYLLAVGITAGFWIGDLFDRRFGAGKKRSRKPA
ncbi:hypothetical protein HGB24_02590 [Candidatus Saccharibacteria bacterium]|nr:hypothetical protein [Candidatus Saccharibacteria bacterium]